MSYDKNGNITALKRKGHTNTAATTFGMMDDLTYTYDTGNKLTKVEDIASLEGFKNGANTPTEYTYDPNGNMLSDANKAITNITYNHLNLPTTVTFSGTNKKIDYFYDAVGTKLKKVVTDASSLITTEYAGNYVYEGGALQFFNTAEGYVEPKGLGWEYVYQYKDHLGNVRLSYKDISLTSTPSLQIVEENNYYPFGLKHKGYNNAIAGGRDHKYKYNGKELNDELGLDWYDYGARNYMPDIGRWGVHDPASDITFDPYGYVYNNPVKLIDENGEFPILSGIGGFFKGLFSSRGSFEPGAETRLGNAFRTAGRYEKQAWQIVGGLGTTDKNKSFGGKVLQLLSRFTWELPNTVAGFVTAESTNVVANVNWVDFEAGATVLNTDYIFGAFTLGSFIIGDADIKADRNDEDFRHEYGHYLQSQTFGVGYLPGFALPSVVRAGLWNIGVIGGEYEDFYTENDATNRGNNYFKKNDEVKKDPPFIDKTTHNCLGCYNELPPWLKLN